MRENQPQREPERSSPIPRRALVQHRPWLVLSIACAVALPFLEGTAWEGLASILVKTGAVGFLALYAAQRTRGLRAGLFVVALALGATGDALIELSFVAGAMSQRSSSTADIFARR